MFATMNVFWPRFFVKFPWLCWTEFSQSWKDLRKTLRSHENLRSLALIISGANIIGFHSNSRDWLFWVFMMSKINSVNEQKCAVLARCVNSIFCLYKSMNESITAPHISSISTFIPDCIDNVELISSNVMRNIRNEEDKTFCKTKWIDCLICNTSIRVPGMICSIILGRS